MKYTLFAILIIFCCCSSTGKKEKVENKESPVERNLEYRKYHLPDSTLKKGIVKVYEVVKDDSTYICYRLVKDTTDTEFVEVNMDSDTNVTSMTYYNKEVFGFTTQKTVSYSKVNNLWYSIEPVKEMFYSYSSTDINSISEYISNPTKCVELSFLTKKIFKEIAVINVMNKNIECLIYSLERDIETKNICKYRQNETSSKSIVYYGKDLGMVKFKAEDETRILIDVLSVDEFMKE